MLLPSTIIRTVSALLLVGFLCQCATKRTVKSTRTRTTFDERHWGGQRGGDDSQEIRKKFAEKGYSFGEDGKIKADRPDLYAGQTARGVGGEFATKRAKFKNGTFGKKEFSTPEYVKRQSFNGVKTASESGRAAREGRGSNSRESGKLFGGREKADSSSDLASYRTSSFRDGDRLFSTQSDARARKALDNSADATGVDQAAGYRSSASMTMDDVKKLVSPRS